ncbi:unnamed protein product, partial [Owenia fusiformis]
YVEFSTDYSFTMRGFHAYYRAVHNSTKSTNNAISQTDVCTNRQMYESTGEISTLGYTCLREDSLFYIGDMNCSWDIHVQEGKVIELMFNEVNTYDGCIYDYVNIIDETGRIDAQPLCDDFGASFPRAVKSLGPWLRVELSIID